MFPALKDNWQSSASTECLQQRARILKSVRAFFSAQQILEVDTPVLSRAAITDPHLHSFSTEFLSKKYYLHTSPEFFMKRLLATGSGDIFQICKVFRDDEMGTYHNAEFTLLEWYRLGFDHHQLMQEMSDLFENLFQQHSTLAWYAPDKISYQQVFLQNLHIDPLLATANDLQRVAEKNHIECPQGMELDNKDMWLDWLMTQAVAPAFSTDRLTFLYDYPASQAALARLSQQDNRVAHRFEVFWGELELANGFWELQDAAEQRQRFEQENQQRQQQGLNAMPLDENLLAALQAGLPDCAGVALGIDRLLMVLLQKKTIQEVLSFDFSRV